MLFCISEMSFGLEKFCMRFSAEKLPWSFGNQFFVTPTKIIQGLFSFNHKIGKTDLVVFVGVFYFHYLPPWYEKCNQKRRCTAMVSTCPMHPKKTGEMVLFQPWIRQEDQRMPQKMLLNGTAKAIATGTKHSLILMEARIFLWVNPSGSFNSSPLKSCLPNRKLVFQLPTIIFQGLCRWTSGG